MEGVRRLCDCGSCPSAAAATSVPGLVIFRPLEKGVQGGELGATAVLCAAMAARRVLLRIGVVRSIRCCVLCECVVRSVVKSRRTRIDSKVVVAGGDHKKQRRAMASELSPLSISYH